MGLLAIFIALLIFGGIIYFFEAMVIGLLGFFGGRMKRRAEEKELRDETRQLKKQVRQMRKQQQTSDGS